MKRLRRFGALWRWGCGLALLAALIGLAFAPGSVPVAASTVTVRLVSGHLFQPENITVNVGTTVTWINKDSVEIHNVFEDTGVFGSPDLNYNDTYSQTFTEPGVVGYHCTYHEGMVGTITVVTPPVSTATPLPLPTRHTHAAPQAPVVSVPPTHVVAPAVVIAPVPLAQPARH